MVDSSDAESEAEGEDEEEEADEEDPAPVIPDGFKIMTEEAPLRHFVFYTRLSPRDRPAWHTGVVEREHPPGFLFRGKHFTHDVKFDGTREVRPVLLTEDLRDQSRLLASH